MTTFEGIKRQIYLKKKKIIENKITKEQKYKCKIYNKYNLEMYEKNRDCYDYLLDRNNYWKKDLKQHWMDLTKFVVGGTAVVGVCTLPFMLVGKYDNAVKFFLFFESLGVYCLGISVAASLLTYKSYRKQTNIVTKHLKREYKPLNRCELRMDKLNEQKVKVEGIIQQLNIDEDVLVRK